MKIIIPVINQQTIASGFNATPEVCIYDMEKDLHEGCDFRMWRDIIPPGSKITLRLKQEEIRAVLTSRMQLLALNLFRDNGIDVYKSDGEDLLENLNKLRQGYLDHYTVEQAMENNQLCGGKCDDCSTQEGDCK